MSMPRPTAVAEAAIIAFSKKKLGYADADLRKDALHIFDAFNVEKLPESSNSGEYKHSSLATLGDSVAGLLLCEEHYATLRKGQITKRKESLQNKVFDGVAIDLGLLDCRYDGERFGTQPLESQFKYDPSALFEAVVGAVYLDLGLEHIRKLWHKSFLPLIEKYFAEIGTAQETVASAEGKAVKEVSFAEADGSAQEMIVYRPRPLKQAKTELKMGQVWFDNSEGRGYDGQGIFFYGGDALTAAREYLQRAGKEPGCVFAYKITADNLPLAKGENVDYPTKWVKIADAEDCYCLKICDASVVSSVFAEFTPYAILCLPSEKGKEIMQFAAARGLPVL